MSALSYGQRYAPMLGPYAADASHRGHANAKKERAMKTLITVAVLALGLAAPALAQDAKPAVTPSMAPAAKPAEAPKATPAATKDAAQPATNPVDAKTG